jgi:hypothetical protein
MPAETSAPPEPAGMPAIQRHQSERGNVSALNRIAASLSILRIYVRPKA